MRAEAGISFCDLSGLEVGISLWSENQERLQQLHTAIELLRQKVIQAGFQCEDIVSKHGMPPKKQKHIQQGLVDIHT